MEKSKQASPLSVPFFWMRHATKNDLSGINEIYNQAVKEKFCTADLEPVPIMTREAWFDEHDNNTYPIWVMEYQQKIIGWVSLSAYRNGRAALRQTTEISYYIDNQYRQCKLGTCLLEHALETALALKFTTVFAIVLQPNAPSIGLLKKFGFDLWGRLPGAALIDGKTYDHLYFGKKLNSLSEPC